MKISKFGVKRQFTLYTLTVFSLVGVVLISVISDYMVSEAVTAKIEIIDLALSKEEGEDLSAIADQPLLNGHAGPPSLAHLITRLNSLSASNYYIWNHSGKLVHQMSNFKAQNKQHFLLQIPSFSSQAASPYKIVDSGNLDTAKELQITRFYKGENENYTVTVVFPYDIIVKPHQQLNGLILIIVFMGLLLLYLLHFPVLLYITRRLNYKRAKLQANNVLMFKAYEQFNRSFNASINALVSAIDARDTYTAAHVNRVMDYAQQIAEMMALSPNRIYQIRLAAQLHDIGKIGTPDSVLLKQGKLNDQEYEIIKNHPDAGVAILQHNPNFANILLAVRHHHERYDGTGYPCGLAGKEIPLSARIIAVADAYDAMTSNRPYRKSLSAADAQQELSTHRGAQFDPEIVDIFIKVLTNNAEMPANPEVRSLTALLPESNI